MLEEKKTVVPWIREKKNPSWGIVNDLRYFRTFAVLSFFLSLSLSLTSLSWITIIQIFTPKRTSTPCVLEKNKFFLFFKREMFSN